MALKVKQFEFNMFGEKTYIVSDPETKQAVIIDPGMSNANENARLDDYIAEAGLTLTHLIVTHVHIDHVLGVEHIEKKYGLPLEASKADAFLSDRIAWQAQMFHLPIKVAKALVIGRGLQAGDVIPIGDDELTVISVPGHSPGSIALYSAKSGIVFTGDALFRNSIGRTDLPGGDYDTLINSITKELGTLPAQTVVYPGHGPSTKIGFEMATNPYL